MVCFEITGVGQWRGSQSIEGAGDEVRTDVQTHTPYSWVITRATEPICMEKSPRILRDGECLIDLEIGRWTGYWQLCWLNVSKVRDKRNADQSGFDTPFC